MDLQIYELIEKLHTTHSLEKNEYLALIEAINDETVEELARLATEVREKIYGRDVFVRGLVEISNRCKNNCLYCGIRRDNNNIHRYFLTPEQILSCVQQGYSLGFRTFVLQGGEDRYYTDELLSSLIDIIKKKHPDCAVTLSLGERGYESFKNLKEAGADRYLLRHETADPVHYSKLHPKEMSYESRMSSLYELRALGYQVGCGFMVGSPYQTPSELAADLKFIEKFKPDMCGIGPFIPHKDTEFRDRPAGDAVLTCYLLSIIRLMIPDILLPATTALATADRKGRERGLLSGANVLMPNLSPVAVRKDYALYDDKVCTGDESAACVECLKTRVASVGYKIVTERGDRKGFL